VSICGTVRGVARGADPACGTTHAAVCEVQWLAGFGPHAYLCPFEKARQLKPAEATLRAEVLVCVCMCSGCGGVRGVLVWVWARRRPGWRVFMRARGSKHVIFLRYQRWYTVLLIGQWGSPG
jgi:hypothetical protein